MNDVFVSRRKVLKTILTGISREVLDREGFSELLRQDEALHPPELLSDAHPSMPPPLSQAPYEARHRGAQGRELKRGSANKGQRKPRR